MHWLASVDPGSDAERGAHGVHAAAPCAAYVLPGHWEQVGDPAGAAVPAAHGWQGVDPPGEAVPAAQGWQPPAEHVAGSLPAAQLVAAPVQPASEKDT